jgi:F0F1-type ATP synthase membrane subunit c/vacuolar-type H+-ATPase subunit K
VGALALLLFRPEQPLVLAGTGATLTPPPTPGSKSNKKVLLIIAVALLVGLCCIGASIVVPGLIGTGVSKVMTEEPKVEKVIDEYLNAMAAQDATKAYSLVSTRAKRNVALGDVQKGLEGNNYTLFEGYESIAMANFNLNLTSDPDPTMPQGQVAEVDGTVSYADGFTGDFNAVLEKEGEEWRLYSINVNAPADKFGQ